MRFNILADTVFKGSDYVLMSGYNTFVSTDSSVRITIRYTSIPVVVVINDLYNFSPSAW